MAKEKMSTVLSFILSVLVVLLLSTFSTAHSLQGRAITRPDVLSGPSNQDSFHSNTRRKTESGVIDRKPQTKTANSSEKAVSFSLYANKTVFNLEPQKQNVSSKSLVSSRQRDTAINATSDFHGSANVTSASTKNVTYSAGEFYTSESTMSELKENVSNVTLQFPTSNNESLEKNKNWTNSATEFYTSSTQNENLTNSTLEFPSSKSNRSDENENLTHSTLELSSSKNDNQESKDNLTNSAPESYDRENDIPLTNNNTKLLNNNFSDVFQIDSRLDDSTQNNSFAAPDNQTISSSNFSEHTATNFTDAPEHNNSPNDNDSDSNLESWTLTDEIRNILSSNDLSFDHSNDVHNTYSSEALPNAGCPACRTREIDRNYRILQFKNQILNTLHLTDLPNITGVTVPKVPALTHLYQEEIDLTSHSTKRPGHGRFYQDQVEYDDDFVVKTERIFISGKDSPIGLYLNLTNTLYFPPTTQLLTSEIATAHLWFYIRKHNEPSLTVTIEKIVPGNKPGRSFAFKKVYSFSLPREKSIGWKRVNMKYSLSAWIRHPITNFGLLIKATDKAGNNLVVLPSSSEVDKGYEPWLDTKIMEPRSHSRHRRSDALLCVENSTDTRCCRHPLLVGFAEFGWDWIIAPTHVKADYCTGECRLTMQDNTPYSWVNQQMSGTSSCCTPTKLSPLPLLYFDEQNNIVYQILQNMKVDKCGCA